MPVPGGGAVPKVSLVRLGLMPELVFFRRGEEVLLVAL